MRNRILHAVEVVLWAGVVAFAAIVAAAPLPDSGLGWKHLALAALAAALVAVRKALAGVLDPKLVATQLQPPGPTWPADAVVRDGKTYHRLPPHWSYLETCKYRDSVVGGHIIVRGGGLYVHHVGD